METFFEIELNTEKNTEFIDITSIIQEKVTCSKFSDGICYVFVPHTTAAITINENADPNVVKDIIATLDKIVPHSDTDYRHSEGNSAAHIKSSLLGSSVTLLIEKGQLKLGAWQGVYFCEFDGPRRRKIWIKTE